jgi:tRNA modification GTPase
MGGDSLGVSVARGDGLAEATRLLETRAAVLLESRGSEPALITRARHREALATARDALAEAERAAAPELIAEELRRAGDAIGRITGRTGVEDMLDLLFAQFCIGK